MLHIVPTLIRAKYTTFCSKIETKHKYNEPDRRAFVAVRYGSCGPNSMLTKDLAGRRMWDGEERRRQEEEVMEGGDGGRCWREVMEGGDAGPMEAVERETTRKQTMLALQVSDGEPGNAGCS